LRSVPGPQRGQVDGHLTGGRGRGAQALVEVEAVVALSVVTWFQPGARLDCCKITASPLTVPRAVGSARLKAVRQPCQFVSVRQDIESVADLQGV
jgi:hypothetical protein